MSPERILLVPHPAMPHAASLAENMSAYLRSQDIDVATTPLHEDAYHQQMDNAWPQVIITLGGDGTMLRAGHQSGPAGIPMLGINMGRLGFLTEAPGEGWQTAVDQLLKGDYWIEPRMMLEAEQFSGEETRGSWLVVNECVVGRGEQVRPVELRTEIDGHHLTRYMADGLIVSTATGSTAYALAAGGPILPPTSRNILLVPVAPHLSVDRAIVLEEDSTVCIRVHTDHLASLCVDGKLPVPLLDGDYVHLRASDHNVTFIRMRGRDYFYRALTSHMNIHAIKGEMG